LSSNAKYRKLLFLNLPTLRLSRVRDELLTKIL